MTTPTDQDFINMFREAVREVDINAKLGEIDMSTHISDLGLSSVDTMEVIGVIEERLELRFSEDDLRTVRSMRDLALLTQKA